MTPEVLQANEKQVQVACQGRIMVCCEIHVAAVARQALAFAQFTDSLGIS